MIRTERLLRLLCHAARGARPKPAGVGLMMLGAAAALGQVRETTTVELIEVPVYVQARDGHPIRGLTKDNFELRVNRRPQTIEYFDRIDFAADSPGAASHDQRERRLYLLLFDESNSARADLARAQRAAMDVVAHSEPTDLFGVATYTANKGVQFSAAFSRDRTAVRRAIGTLSASVQRDPFGLALTEAERMTWGQQDDDLQLMKTGKYDEEVEQIVRGGAVNQEMLAQQSKDRVLDLLGNFADLAVRLSDLEGQKHVLLFSDGFNGSILHGGETAVPANIFSAGGVDAHALHVLDDMFRSYRDAGVFLDTVDIGGVRHSFVSSSGWQKDSLQVLAHGTGGEFVQNQNDLAKALDELTQGQQVVYLLGFTRHDVHSGSIEVRVRGIPRGSRVSFRQGFGGAGQSSTVDPLRLADILVNNIPQNGFKVAIDASASEVRVTLSRAEIVPQLVDKTPYIDVLIYVFTENGSAVVGDTRTIGFTQADRDRKDDEISVSRHFTLPPGRYVAKAIARIAGTKSLGFARVTFTVNE